MLFPLEQIEKPPPGRVIFTLMHSIHMNMGNTVIKKHEQKAKEPSHGQCKKGIHVGCPMGCAGMGQIWHLDDTCCFHKVKLHAPSQVRCPFC